MRRFYPIVLFVVLLPVITGTLMTAARAAPDKIAPWVLEHTANGAEAEFLVVLKQQADLNGAARLTTKAEKGRYVYTQLWRTAQTSQASLLAWLKARGVPHRAYYIVNLIWVKGNADLVYALAARPDVARIEGNPRIQNPLPQPARPLDVLLASVSAPTGIEPNIAYVHAPEVWAMGFTGQGIVVGGQDTGYDWTHPALKPHYRGWNGTTANHDYNWHDAIHSGGGTCGPDSPVPCDDYGHGTHTMGTIVGDDGGTNRIGMAPGAQWIGCRNMDRGNGTPATYLECFEFFLAPYPVGGTPAQGNPDKAPDVTNNSWTCPTSEGCSWATLQAAVEAQRAAGIMTVVSAGNYGSNCSTINEPPAIYAAAYTVGALQTGTDTIASLSSRGPVTVDGSNRRKPDIVAPGTSIRSCVPGGGYGYKTGTSMAAPHVAGAVALLWSAAPWVKNQLATTEQLLNANAVHIASSACGSTGWPNNTYGYGRLDIQAAVAATLGSITYGVALAPPWIAQHGAPGQTLSVTLRITNTGVVIDSFNITLTGAHWPTTAPQVIGPLAAGEATALPVTVTLPVTASCGMADNLTLKATSAGDPTRSAQATLRTTADPVYGVTAYVTANELLAAPGAAAGTTLWVTNAGNCTDAFMVQAASVWPVSGAATTGALAAGASVSLPVTVTVPAAAPPGTSATTILTVTSQTDGSISTTLRLTTTSQAPYCIPIANADFDYTPASPGVGATVTLTGTVASGTPPRYYTWNFGDGSALGTGEIVTHTFPAATIALPYTVIMTVENACSYAVAQRTLTVRGYTRLYLPLVLVEQ